MDVTITPGRLEGSVTPPPSKSQGHRLLIAAALAGEGSAVRGLGDSQDIQATKRCLAALLDGGDGLPLLDCGESGSTLRFLIPVALALRGGGRFTGRGRLMERPQQPYFDLFDEKGVRYERRGGVLTVRGTLAPGEYRLRGDVSSQFVTGLLYALPLLGGDSRIVLTTPLESKGYVDMTLEALRAFRVSAGWEGERALAVPGAQKYFPAEARVEADWSQAAFWLAAAALGSPVRVEGMNAFSAQGDMAVAAHYLRLSRPGDVEIDVSQCPDLVPPLCAVSAVRRGTCRIVNAARLRIKESDRLAAVTKALGALGAEIEEFPDSLTVRGKDGLPGGAAVDSRSDHRIAMMAAVAATRCERPVTVLGAECVAKSYPHFWEDYEKLGGRIARREV